MTCEGASREFFACDKYLNSATTLDSRTFSPGSVHRQHNSVILGNAFGEVPEFAQMQFLLMAVPGFLLALLGLVAREPKAGDTRWYTRPTMTIVYRVGGVLMLIAACVLGVQA